VIVLAKPLMNLEVAMPVCWLNAWDSPRSAVLFSLCPLCSASYSLVPKLCMLSLPSFPNEWQRHGSPLISVLEPNVRGLNDPDRCTTMNESIAASTCTIACLQESKLQNFDAAAATAFTGGFRLRAFAHLPVIRTQGGVIILWDDNYMLGSDVTVGTFCVSITFKTTRDDLSFRPNKE
jgi:hypothetical protein